AATLEDPLAELVRFGVRPPPDIGTLGLTANEQTASTEALVAEANSRIAAADLLLTRAAAESPGTAAALAGQALATIFGTGFITVPLLLAPPPGEADLWAGGAGPAGVRARPGADIRPWLVRAGALRAASSLYGETLLVREASGRRPLLCVVQTPAGGFGTWVGLPFPNAVPPTVPLVSTVVEIAGAGAGDPEPELTGAIAGLVLDEWTEVVPRRLERRNPTDPDAAPDLVDVTTTGMAINANAPGARPPQSILVALSADGDGWNGERLVHLLDEAMALARMRTVTLQQIPFAGSYLPALYFGDWSLQGEPVIDWLKVSVQYAAEHSLKYLKVKQ
ncbi:MAG: hypothetical protein JWQ75_2853, partial [Pseudarthrobacter sp.]|nr:hypothetical protein [Pseudarthrobacter sp.]